MTTRSGSRRRRPGQVRAAVIAALLVGSCATPSPTPTPASSSTAGIRDAATTDCSAFASDPSGVFYPPPGLSFHDPSPLDVPTGTPAEVGLDASLLETAATNAALSIDIRSLLVVRHGKLVFERYFNGSDASEAGTIASASKRPSGSVDAVWMNASVTISRSDVTVCMRLCARRSTPR